MREPSVVPGLAPPWWLEEAIAAEGDSAVGARHASPDSPAVGAGLGTPLQGGLEVDVAIVGGGYTGLWTALALREREPSLRVALLEAEVVGWGPSGRNGGFLHGYWSNLGRLRELFGDSGALDVARAAARAIPAVRRLCEQRGEDVWLREAGFLKVSAAPAQDSAIERLAASAKALGVEEEAVPLSAEEVAERCRSPRFRGGVFLRDCATVQPARLARALGRAVLAEGVVLHERTRVQAIRAGSPNRLETPEGRIAASEVIVALNAAAAGWKPVRRQLTNFGSYVVLTDPVPNLLEEIVWTQGEAIADGRMFVHYFRTTPDTASAAAVRRTSSSSSR